MTSLWQRGGLSWRRLMLRVWRQVWLDELPGRCAELAYYFLFSVFPLLIFMTTLLGYLAGPDTRLRIVLFHWVARFAPSPDVTELLSRTLDETARRGGGAKLSLSLLVALWVASSGMLAMVRALNSTYSLEETRPWWKRRLVAVALTIAFAALIVCALAVILYGHLIGGQLALEMGVGPAFVASWRVLRWPLVLVFVLFSFEGIYNYAPNRGAGARRPWGTPGAVIGVALWLAVSFGLRFYLMEVRSYAVTYGSLGAVIVLLLWFYLTGFAILVGGEVNSEISRQIKSRQQPGAAVKARPRQLRRRPAARI